MNHETLELNKKIYDFWNNDFLNAEQKKDYHLYLPAFLSDIQKSTLTIIGCNPSLNKNGYKNCFKGTTYEDLDFFKRISREENENFSHDFQSNIIELHDIEGKIGSKHPYVLKLIDVTTNIGIKDFKNDVTVLDLFFIRDTNQKNIEKRLKQKISNTRPVKYEFTTFAEEQIKISMEALSLSDPDLILIANAKASNIFIEYNKDKIYSKQFGDLKCYIFKLNGRSVPIFFSSMLSGQRALDTFSLDRLIWDMTQILKKIRENQLDMTISI
ncbi:hypothetical protein [Neobacillus drentensis]|uniref:hypothetical protein n=1 Tax=Neobacillus drentensis TaxID=220684 RepID=UPI002FFF3183